MRAFLNWVLSPAGIVFVISSVRELYTRPDRDLFINTVGEFVSIHSIYWSTLAVGIVFIVPGALATLDWWNTTYSAVGRFRKLESKLENMAYRFNSENPYYEIGEIRDLRFALAKIGIEYPLDGINAKLRLILSKDLLAACRNGEIKYARAAWSRLQNANTR